MRVECRGLAEGRDDAEGEECPLAPAAVAIEETEERRWDPRGRDQQWREKRSECRWRIERVIEAEGLGHSRPTR